MHDWQVKWIEKNMSELIDKTIYNPILFSDLEFKGLLEKEEVTELERIRKHEDYGEFKMVSKLYFILKTRRDAYETLIQVLTKCGLTDAASILEKGREKEETDSAKKKPRLQNYQYLPSGVDHFLKSTSGKICVVSTRNCEITVDRLSDAGGIQVVEKANLEHNILEASSKFIVSHVDNLEETLSLVRSRYAGMRCRIIIVTGMKKEAVEKIENFSELILVEDKLTWQDLSDSFKAKLLNQQVLVQGRNLPLANLIQLSGQSQMENEINGDLLIDLINDTTPVLLEDTLPSKLPYYIERKLRSRNQMSVNKIFSKRSKDIFVFSGLERYQLSDLVSKGKKDSESTDTSRNQIRQKSLTVRYILLQTLKSDFDQICKKTNKPVHWLHHDKNKKIRWIKSKGSMTNIQRMLEDVQDNPNETSFIEKISNNDIADISQQAVCISDSPGMGKSILLAEIGRKLLLQSNSLVVFQRLPELVKHMSKFKSQKKKNPLTEEAISKSLLQYLISLITTTIFSENLIISALEKGNVKVNLLVDAYDEVPFKNMQELNTILRILSTMKNVRVFATARPHFLGVLENAFSVLGWSIMPFTENDQNNFLVSFWKTKSPHLDVSKLKKFTSHYVTALKAKWNKKERTTSGIPLQCHLIAEIYEDEASDCANPENILDTSESEALPPEIRTVTELYTKLVEKKLQTYKSKFKTKLSLKSIRKWHSYLAFSYLFPDINVKKLIEGETISAEAILNIGIIEGSIEKDQIQFIHRTFAEYFVALTLSEIFITSSSGKYGNALKKTLRSLFMDLLKLSNSSIKNIPQMFEYEGMLHHVNYFLKNKPLLPKAPFSLKSSLANLALAFVFSDLEEIFNLFVNWKLFNKNEAKIFTKKLILVAIKHSSLSLIKTVQNHILKSCDQQLIEMEYEDSKTKTLLHAAVARGHYNIFEFIFLNCDGFLDKVKQCEGEDTIKNLLHTCVESSWQDSYIMIHDKIQIIKLLLKKNNKLLEYHNDEGCSPLLCKLVHFRILIELIESGANVLQKHESGSGPTVLHKVTEYLSSEEYSQLLDKLPLTSFQELICGDDYPLNTAVYAFDLTDKTLALCVSAGFDFNTKAEDGSSLLEHALHGNRSLDFLQRLIKHGAKFDVVNTSGESALHIVAKDFYTDAIPWFIEKRMDVNCRDKNGCTPLHAAILQLGVPIWTKISIITFNILLEQGADLHAVNNRKENVLHLAAEKSFEEVLQYFIDRKVDINGRDCEKNTPLMFAARNKYPISIVNLLQSNGARADSNEVNIRGENLLHVTMVAGKYQKNDHKEVESLVDLCIEKFGISPNSRDSKRNTPLHSAAAYYCDCHCVDIVTHLVKKGADIKLVNTDNLTFLEVYLTRHICKLEVVKYFSQYFRNLDLMTVALKTFISRVWGYTNELESVPVILEAESNREASYVEIGTILINYGADVKSLTNHIFKVLEASVTCPDLTFLQFLAIRGDFSSENISLLALRQILTCNSGLEDGEEYDDFANTLVQYVTVEKLVEYKDADSNTLLQLASKAGCQRGIIYLASQGIDFNEMDN